MKFTVIALKCSPNVRLGPLNQKEHEINLVHTCKSPNIHYNIHLGAIIDYTYSYFDDEYLFDQRHTFSPSNQTVRDSIYLLLIHH